MHFLKTLRIRLLLLVLLSVIPMVGLTLFTAFEEREREKTAIMDEALRLARLASSSGERLIESTHQLLMALLHILAVRERHVEECNTFLADMIAHYPSYTNLGVSDPRGNLSCSGAGQLL